MIKWFTGILIAAILAWMIISPCTVQLCILGASVLCYIAVLIRINRVNRKLDDAVRRLEEKGE